MAGDEMTAPMRAQAMQKILALRPVRETGWSPQRFCVQEIHAARTAMGPIGRGDIDSPAGVQGTALELVCGRSCSSFVIAA